MNSQVLVSVIIPAYNAADFLADAVDSVRQQTYPHHEIIIVNDGSTDQTGELSETLACADPRIRVVHQANAGLPAARNAGLREVRGSYINFLDADDALLPDKLERQVKFLEENPHIDLVFSDYFRGDHKLCPNRLIETGRSPLEIREIYVFRNNFAPMVPLLRTSLQQRVGEFDTGFRAAEDWDYWTRCAHAGAFAYLPGAVAVYREHGAQMHRQVERMRVAEQRLIDKHYRKDPARYRMARGGRHWYWAKHFYFHRQHLPMLLELAQFVLTVRDIRRMRLITKVFDF